MLLFLFFLFINEPQEVSQVPKKKKKKAAQLFLILIINQHIRMISEGSSTEDWSNDAENSALQIIFFKYIKIDQNIILNCNNISQYYSFFCIFDPINAGLMSIRHFHNAA